MKPPAQAMVPARYRGVWQRTLLETPEGSDTATTVFWLQAGRWHADIRLPDGRPDFSGIRSLAECGPAQIAWLAGQQGFAGITTVSAAPDGREICQWHRLVDFQPPAATPDAGAMRFRGDELTETGVHAHYLETWRRLPDSAHGRMVLQLHDPADRPCRPMRLLMVTGRHVMHVRSRSAPWPAGVAPGTSLADLAGAGKTALLDFEISFGRLGPDGWTIARSTLPWRENATIAMRIGRLDGDWLEVDFDGDAQRWRVLEWTMPATPGDRG